MQNLNYAKNIEKDSDFYKKFSIDFVKTITEGIELSDGEKSKEPAFFVRNFANFMSYYRNQFLKKPNREEKKIFCWILRQREHRK